MEFKSSILDYIGKYENGILVSIGLTHKEKYYDAIFYYTDKQMIISIDEKLSAEIGQIENHPDYLQLMKEIINSVDPFESIVRNLSTIDETYKDSEI